MLKHLAKACATIANAESLPDLEACLTKALNELGFISYNISLNRSDPLQFMERPLLTTWTTRDLDIYVNDGWFDRDPLMSHLKANTAPLFWKPGLWDGTPRQDYSEYVRYQGIAGGATLPLFAAPGKFSAITLLTIDKSVHVPDTAHAISILTSVATARMSAFTEGLPCQYNVHGFKQLSGLQVEILSWIAKGKTNSEIALIVGRTERAIAYHVSEILAKISVSSRAQAAAFYAALGLRD
ncbi:LuxR family transcriptional regulator [Martelella sp. AD-3]|uniref:helix-turn-helix transcriptional regulator n=1 Tax=Martelella sp. AD-3 TaxID=686597 RepID=UPI000467C752|nr:LuxR family transcriptional regulator [Martelella sp. AD-3]AMM83461.1 hypothetical protein AZF01_03060 [Martelella sp. AD-3]